MNGLTTALLVWAIPTYLATNQHSAKFDSQFDLVIVSGTSQHSSQIENQFEKVLVLRTNHTLDPRRRCPCRLKSYSPRRKSARDCAYPGIPCGSGLIQECFPVIASGRSYASLRGCYELASPSA